MEIAVIVNVIAVMVAVAGLFAGCNVMDLSSAMGIAVIIYAAALAFFALRARRASNMGA